MNNGDIDKLIKVISSMLNYFSWVSYYDIVLLFSDNNGIIQTKVRLNTTATIPGRAPGKRTIRQAGDGDRVVAVGHRGRLLAALVRLAAKSYNHIV